MQVNRRLVFKTLAAAGAAAVAKGTVDARTRPTAAPDAMGLLYDTTRCIGCKACVVACREANHTKPETSQYGGIWDAPPDLDGDTKTVIKLYKAADGAQWSYFKAQCMQCVDPACTNACMLGALKKRDGDHGIVSYDASKCIGCRYCQMACPFNIPKFQWSSNWPGIVKCELCRDRVQGAALAKSGGFTRYPAGHGPACAEVCPRQAVIYGTREELLAEARRRMAENPGRYVDKIYGEFDGGGTQCLYLSHVPFDKLRLPTLSNESVPNVQQTIQHGIYQGFVAPVALYGLLTAAVWRSRRNPPPSDGEKGEPS
ncbi:MAG TPA: hydrogenase 2 operon protein HybA [Thermoanaerobaculia bacterium]|jgi:Fe-S-cluster-containing dehydrogenase component|nr:hydrogenase 2 operon protein HybA [Thermoanaerobaculia bacterium]